MLEHRHLIIRAEVFSCPSKHNLDEVLDWMKLLTSSIDMKVMFGPNITYVDQIGNRGITCMALIETSHIVLHIWDEPIPGLFQLDIYSCKDFSLSTVIDLLNKSFKVDKLQYKFLDRKSNLILVEESS